MAIQSPEDTRQQPNQPVLANHKDPKGFNPIYQQILRERIIGQHVGPLLSQCQALETIPPSEIIGDEPPNKDTAEKKTQGIVLTHIAPNLITSDGQRAGDRAAARRKTSA